jgi:hypothetical protein
MIDKQLLEFCRFIDDNKKTYINANTGKGKTLLASLLALFFLETHPSFKVISNYKLNIFDKKTNKSKCEFTKFGLLPFNKLKEGNYLIIIDDYKAVMKYLENFGSILAIFSRKANIYVIITLHYYTHLTKENREMFNNEILLELTNLIYDYSLHQTVLSIKSKLKAIFLEPSTLEVKRIDNFNNLLFFVKGNYELKNVSVKGFLYNTYEVVGIPLFSDILKEILNFSNTKRELAQNIQLITKSTIKQEKIFKRLVVQKDFII